MNGLYGMYYRKVTGGKGYVFQGRFNSTLIEKDAYLLHSIAYLLRNPVRAGIVPNAEDYIWSSIKAYYSNSGNEIVDAEFVDELFGTKEELMVAIQTWGVREPPVVITKYGEVLGSEDFFTSAIINYDRRERPTNQSIGTQRKEDVYFEPVEKVLWEFERINDVKVEEIDITTIKGKRQRGALLVLLKEKAGLTYKEISGFDIFGDLKLGSLGRIYKNMKSR